MLNLTYLIMTILYIDDDADDREIFMEAVKTISPEIVCYEACDGVEGLVTLHSLVIPPDVIFLDVNMPRMNGKQSLRSEEHTSELQSQSNIVCRLLLEKK